MARPVAVDTAAELARAEYVAALARAPDCIHGQRGGDLVRPWCSTPACPFCRRRHPVHWRRHRADPAASTPTPAPVELPPVGLWESA